MGIASRLKAIGGGSLVTNPFQIASATTIVVPPDTEFVELTGTTTIGTVNYDRIRPGRQLHFFSRDASGCALTDTAIASTAAGKLHLSAAITVLNGTNITFRQAPNGSWWECARAVNG